MRGGLWHKHNWEVIELIFRTSCTSEPRWDGSSSEWGLRARYLYVIAKWLGYSSPQDTTNTAGPRRALSFSSTYLYEPEKMKIPTRLYLMLLVIALTKVQMTHSYNYSIRIGNNNNNFLHINYSTYILYLYI